MRITKNTGILAEGTVVCLPGGDEVCEIREYIESAGQYRVIFLEFNGSEFVPNGDERVICPCDLVGGTV